MQHSPGATFTSIEVHLFHAILAAQGCSSTVRHAEHEVGVLDLSFELAEGKDTLLELWHVGSRRRAERVH